MEEAQSPKVVSITMDGNRRWAKFRGLPEIEGHKATINNIEEIVKEAAKLGIKKLIFWIFSTENFNRDKKFLHDIFSLFRKHLKDGSYFEKLVKLGGRVGILGDLSLFPKDISSGIKNYLAKGGAKDPKIDVIFAMGYGGRDEMVRAFKKMVKEKVPVEKISEKEVYKYLDLQEDVDLMIRTGARQRTSGLFIYQAAYAELYFTHVLCPDFTVKEFREALADFAQRQRNFGK